jgi:hypothetical protein
MRLTFVNLNLVMPSSVAAPRHGRGIVFDAGKGPRMWFLGWRDYYGGYANSVWRSTDENGTSWEPVQQPESKLWSPTGVKDIGRTGFGCVVFNKKIWIFGGYVMGTYFKDVWSSPDGVNWTLETDRAEWTPRAWFGATTFTLPPSMDQIWLCCGGATYGPSGSIYTNEVYYTDTRYTVQVDNEERHLGGSCAPFAPADWGFAVAHQWRYGIERAV